MAKPLSVYTKIAGIELGHALGVSRQTVTNWTESGCPRNADKSYSIPDVFKWRMAKFEEQAATPATLKEEKLKKEIEFLQTRINEKNDTTMDRALAEQIMVSRASSLRVFMEKTFMTNSVHLAGKTVDEVRTITYQLVQQAMEAYIGKVEP